MLTLCRRLLTTSLFCGFRLVVSNQTHVTVQEVAYKLPISRLSFGCEQPNPRHCAGGCCQPPYFAALDQYLLEKSGNLFEKLHFVKILLLGGTDQTHDDELFGRNNKHKLPFKAIHGKAVGG